jgi:two-component system sensor histidine kinase/response regulator
MHFAGTLASRMNIRIHDDPGLALLALLFAAASAFCMLARVSRPRLKGARPEPPFVKASERPHDPSHRVPLPKRSALSAKEVRILIAEDHPMNQMLFTRLMLRFGIKQFRIVGNGLEASDVYAAEPWDMILMDCHMPIMNGYDAAVHIRAFERAGERPRVPMIAMTANAMVGDRENCLRCGMDDYISKPIVVEELTWLMAQWIDFDNLSLAESPPKTHRPGCIDLTQLRGFTDGDTEMERELIRIFVDQSDINVAALASNQTDGIAPEWVEAAHMLKGGAAGIGAKVLRGICEEAQTMENATAEDRAFVFHSIASAYANVKDALREERLLA